MNPWDYGTVAFSLGILAIYHIHYYTSIITRGSASHTALSTNVKIALSWIRKHKEKGDAPNVTLAIQTLRNTILIAIFVGGNSLSFGLNYSIDYNGIIGNEVQQLQYIIMCVCLLCSFLCWACVIRYASHVGYYIGTLSYMEIEKPKAQDRKSIDSSNNNHPAIIDIDDNEVDLENQDMHLMINCANMIALSLIFFNLGFRFMFIALPFAFFSMGRIGLFVATFGILIFLVAFDYSASYALFSKNDLFK